jgi:hypothetical protein
MSNVNGPVCQCGESMDMYHGVKLCPHCDQGCTVPSCPVCRRYQYWLGIRVTNEHTAERKKWREQGR